jgi:hypothetical protein
LGKPVNQKIKMNDWITIFSMIGLCLSRNSSDSFDKEKKLQNPNDQQEQDRDEIEAISHRGGIRCISKSLSDSLRMKSTNRSFKQSKRKKIRIIEEPG